jgi:Xaa-Pro dipeptidase
MKMSIDPALLDLCVDHCRARQQRLLTVMQQQQLDAVVVMTHEHVQWLSGVRFNWHHFPAAMLTAEGRLTVIAPNKAPTEIAADDVRTYEANSLSTLRNDQRQKCSAVLAAALNEKPLKRIGVEFSACSQHLLQAITATVVDAEPALFELRRFKHADELARLKKAIAGTGVMYAKAREMIQPGVCELDVFNELQAAAVREYGEMLTGTGNDYACAVHGGAPRPRKAQAGELYILDLGPAYRGYFADNSRVICVGGKPTDRQHAAWETVAKVFPMIEATVKPGVRAQDVFNKAKEIIGSFPGGTWRSHLGHGIGLFPHEAPHLNPNWDDTFAEGEVIAVEPAVYADDELKAGIRLENNYLITKTGVELLSPFHLGLV